MKKNLLFFVISVFLLQGYSANQNIQVTDICIYGGTSGGVMSAVAASRLGKTVILIEPSVHIGGLSSGGLGATDIGNKYAVTGLARDFYRQLGLHYGRFEMWTFEPRVAEELFNQYLKSTNIKVLKGYLLNNLKKKGDKIESISVIPSEPDGTTQAILIKAKVYIDASYEGDLMSESGVAYIVGREANSVYNETLNGVQLRNFHQFPDGIDPYIVPGKPESGLVYGISSGLLQKNGSGDSLVQAYNYRLCLTKNQENMIPVVKPEFYDPSKYELLKRLIALRKTEGWKHTLNSYLLIKGMPGNKTDMNNMGPFSTDFIGENRNYPEADYYTRKKIAKDHEEYIKGYLYYLGNDPSVPDTLRQQMKQWGFAKDEFQDNQGFPHQLYVRESRRMIGDFVMTEHHCRGDKVVDDGIGMAAYTMDSHNCQRVVLNGMVKNEGDVQVGGFPPYPVSYHSIVPKRNECTNLLVPVCLSASHIAYGSIRMEPVFMVLGQSAAIAASFSIDRNIHVQDVDAKEIQKINSENPLLDGTLPEILIDNADALYTSYIGDWIKNKEWVGQYKNDCVLLDKTEANTPAYFTFSTDILSDAEYQVLLYIPANRKNASKWHGKVPVCINSGAINETKFVDFGGNAHQWISLGNYFFSKDQSVNIKIDATGISGSFPADALLLKPAGKIEVKSY